MDTYFYLNFDHSNYIVGCYITLNILNIMAMRMEKNIYNTVNIYNYYIFKQILFLYKISTTFFSILPLLFFFYFTITIFFLILILLYGFQVTLMKRLELWYLTPLSTIFQLYRGGIVRFCHIHQESNFTSNKTSWMEIWK